MFQEWHTRIPLARPEECALSIHFYASHSCLLLYSQGLATYLRGVARFRKKCQSIQTSKASRHPKHPGIQSIPNIQLSKESRITKQRQPAYRADGGAPCASLGRHQSAGAGSPAGTWRTLPTIAHRHMQRMIVSTASARASSPWRRCVSLVCRERPGATVAAPPLALHTTHRHRPTVESRTDGCHKGGLDVRAVSTNRADSPPTRQHPIPHDMK